MSFFRILTFCKQEVKVIHIRLHRCRGRSIHSYIPRDAIVHLHLINSYWANMCLPPNGILTTYPLLPTGLTSMPNTQ